MDYVVKQYFNPDWFLPSKHCVPVVRFSRYQSPIKVDNKQMVSAIPFGLFTDVKKKFDIYVL